MTQNEPAAIENAEAIIERFGGIRPMASKINVPVTTVQGWKKRNVIPGTRRAEILSAARQLGVDLTDVLSETLQTPKTPSTIANENDRGPSFARMVEEQAKPAVPSAPPSALQANVATATSPARKTASADTEIHGTFENQLARTERRAVTKSTAINLFIVALIVGSVVLLLLPETDRRLDTLETDVGSLKDKQSFLSRLIPDDLEAEIAGLKAEAGKLQASIGSMFESAKTVSSEIMTTTPDNIGQRVRTLETHVTEMTGVQAPAALMSLVQRFEGLSQTLAGQEQLQASAAQLLALLSGVPVEDPAQVDQALQAAPAQTPQLAETFEGVPPQDIKAAAMLLGMTQFRSSLNRDNKPFADDLALLMKLAGPDDPELIASLERLAPYAEQGVLTPGGLTSEFKSIAGDVVVASLQGEDVSIKDKAQARLGDMFKVEKNGEPVGGTPAQNTVAKTDKLLESGDLEGAIAQMQTLQGPAAIVAQPWITKANATLMAQKVKGMLSGAVGGTAVGETLYNTSGPMPFFPKPAARQRGLNIPAHIPNSIPGNTPNDVHNPVLGDPAMIQGNPGQTRPQTQMPGGPGSEPGEPAPEPTPDPVYGPADTPVSDTP